MAIFGTGLRFGSFEPQPITFRTISISGLPQDVRVRELLKLLKEKSGFIDLELDLEGKEPICFAVFSTQRDATKAIRELQNMVFDPKSSILLRVEFGKNNPFLETGGSEGKKTFIRGEGIHGYFFGESPYKSCLYLSKEDYLETCFVPYKTNEEALAMYKLLVAQHNEGMIICCHTPLQHKDDWFLPIERAKLLLSYFTEKLSMWKSIRPNIFAIEARGSWFEDIKNDMKLIFGTTARIWAELMTDSSETSVYTNSPDTGIWITAKNQIKVLPVLKESPNQIDIQHLSKFMKKIISLPFGANDYFSRKNDYRLDAEIISFLECLSGRY